jgi:hypothetical protein
MPISLLLQYIYYMQDICSCVALYVTQLQYAGKFRYSNPTFKLRSARYYTWTHVKKNESFLFITFISRLINDVYYYVAC